MTNHTLRLTCIPWWQRSGIIVALYPFWWGLSAQRLEDARILRVGPLTISLHLPTTSTKSSDRSW